MTDWASCIFRQVLRAGGCVTVVLVLNCPSEFSLAQGPTGTVASLIALETYLNEECDVAGTKRETCGVKRLIPYKNDAVLKQRLLQILTSEPDLETLQKAQKVIDKQWEVFQVVARQSHGAATPTMTKDAYSKYHLDRLLRIYQEKATMGLATIDPEEAQQVLADAEQRGDQVLAAMLTFALSHHHP